MIAVATITTAMTNGMRGISLGLFPSMRNLLDKSSAAQSLDGVAVWRGACVSP
jgi:hypothetical protein